MTSSDVQCCIGTVFEFECCLDGPPVPLSPLTSSFPDGTAPPLSSSSNGSPASAGQEQEPPVKPQRRGTHRGPPPTPPTPYVGTGTKDVAMAVEEMDHGSAESRVMIFCV